MKKFWTTDKNDFIQEKLGTWTYKELCEHFNVTETALMVQIKRLKIKRKVSLHKHNFFTQQDLIKDMKELGINVSRDVLLAFRKNHIIKSYKTGDKCNIVMFKEKTFFWLKDFFTNNIRVTDLVKQLQEKEPKIKNILKNWLSVKSIREFLNPKTFKNCQDVWLPIEKANYIKSLLFDYYLVSKVSKLTYYSVAVINKLAKYFIKGTVFFANKFWIPKSKVIDIRQNKHLKEGKYCEF